MMPVRSLATFILLSVFVLGILAIPSGAFIGIDSPFDGAPVPMAELLRKRSLGKAVLFTGGGAVAAALGLYAVGREHGQTN